MFTKGFRINGKHSYNDYGLYISKRTIGLPTKTSIRKTVPFMNGFYDFSRINGGDTWGERTISYTFDIVCDTVEATDAECTRILNWLGNIFEADIYDDTMPDYHFHGSFESASPAESEDGEKVELTVNFICQPFKINNSTGEEVL
jgi:phage-related protein